MAPPPEIITPPSPRSIGLFPTAIRFPYFAISIGNKGRAKPTGFRAISPSNAPTGSAAEESEIYETRTGTSSNWGLQTPNQNVSAGWFMKISSSHRQPSEGGYARGSKRVLTCAALAGLGTVMSLSQPLRMGAAAYTFTDLNTSPFMETQGQGASGDYQVGYGFALGQGGEHALLWSGTGRSVVDLNPNGFLYSYARAISDGQVVGYGAAPNSSGIHALLWSLSANSVTDLNPNGYLRSYAMGLSGSQQIGYGYPTEGITHALLWSGTAPSAVDLHPAGFTQSQAIGVSGQQQIGSGLVPGPWNYQHALLWSGSASSVVDLNPSGFTDSSGLSISGGHEAGSGAGPATGGYYHALLWSGTASSVVDLNPAGMTGSWCYGSSSGQQVGYGYGPATGNNDHALVWSGTADSAVDLKNFLSADYGNCCAWGVDEQGNIIGLANHIPTGEIHAMLWTPVPEPSAGWILTLGGAAVLARRRMFGAYLQNERRCFVT
jgi:hypothetical protein